MMGRRQVDTVKVISREVIKPSSPTPSHLNTYYLSELDQFAPYTYAHLILFYPTNIGSAQETSRELKKSLSQTLTQYYPFAGRFINSPTPTPTPPFVACNDEGVVFVEANIDSPLDKFQNDVNENDEAFSQLFANVDNPPHNSSKGLVEVQINHFACGGIGVAVSMSHKIGDGCTLGSFVSHWASVARYGATEVLPLLKPYFIHSPAPTATSHLPVETSFLNQSCANHVSKTFVFPNSKLTNLKNKILATSTLPINNLTRVEVLTSLLYKTAVAATTSGSESFKPSYLFMPVDIRKKFVPMLPQTTVGNIVSIIMVESRHSSETSLSAVISELQKAKKEVKPVESVQQAYQNALSFLLRLGNIEDHENLAKRSFWCSSLCGFPSSILDFGWGKPTGVTINVLRSIDKTCFMLTDTPDGDGIQARVALEKQHMEIFQNDKELLSFCQNN